MISRCFLDALLDYLLPKGTDLFLLPVKVGDLSPGETDYAL